jgi:predicted Zn-dependent protease
MFRLACYAGIVFAIYWFGFRDGCGTKGALACPPPELEEGIGVTLDAREVCPGSGYLCAQGRNFQVIRWGLDKGKLRVRVPPVEFLQGESERRVRAAVVEGIRAWDRKPFPIVIDDGNYTLRFWDIRVVWTQGLNNHALGQARVNWKIDGKRMRMETDGMAVVIPPAAASGFNEGLHEYIKAVTMHEMSHALGIMWHSDSKRDIMYPQILPSTMAELSERDLRTVEALYELPNGAMVQ